MEVGSLIECVGADALPKIFKPLKQKGMYVVRGFRKGYSDNGVYATGVHLEEIYNDISDSGEEPAYDIKRFREVQPPMDLTELLEHQHPHLLT